MRPSHTRFLESNTSGHSSVERRCCLPHCTAHGLDVRDVRDARALRSTRRARSARRFKPVVLRECEHEEGQGSRARSAITRADARRRTFFPRRPQRFHRTARARQTSAPNRDAPIVERPHFSKRSRRTRDFALKCARSSPAGEAKHHGNFRAARNRDCYASARCRSDRSLHSVLLAPCCSPCLHVFRLRLPWPARAAARRRLIIPRSTHNNRCRSRPQRSRAAWP